MRRQIFELQSQSKTVSIVNQAKNVQNPFLTNNIGDGTFLLNRFLVELGNVQKLVELMRSIHFLNCLLQWVSFTADSNLL